MRHLLLLIICSGFSLMAFAQNECTVVLSEAEEAYRNGEFYKVKEVCKCFGTFIEKDKYGPRRIRMLSEGLQKYDSLYNHILGDFQDFSSEILEKARSRPIKDSVFTKEERRRAYILLGKTYQSLGAVKSSGLIAERLVIEHPTVPVINDDNPVFQKTYNEELHHANKHSLGMILGWLYTIPIATTNNRTLNPDFKWQNIGSVLLGVHYNYFINPSYTFSFNFWWHNTKIEYKESNTDGSVAFFHQESQNWLKFPLLLKFSNPEKMSWLKDNEDLAAQWFVQAGLSVNVITSAKANISVPAQGLTLTNFNVIDGRNPVNADLLLGIGSKFRFGRNYITVGFNGTLGLKEVLKQGAVGSNETEIYRQYHILENNYKTLSGFYSVTYEVIFNKLKKKYRVN